LISQVLNKNHNDTKFSSGFLNYYRINYQPHIYYSIARQDLIDELSINNAHLRFNIIYKFNILFLIHFLVHRENYEVNLNKLFALIEKILNCHQTGFNTT